MTVYGTPAPQGSKKIAGRAHKVLVDDNPHALASWREDVKHAALTALADAVAWNRDYPAYVAHMTFTLPRPAYHFGTGRNDRILKPNAPHRHASKPDLDKLVRSTFDALTVAGVYVDDRRVAQLYAVKLYVGTAAGALDHPGAQLTLIGVSR